MLALRAILSELIAFLWIKSLRVRLFLILSLSVIFATAGINLCIPLILRAVIDKIADKNQLTTVLLIMVIGYGVVWTFGQIFQQLRIIIFYKAMAACTSNLKLRIFKHILSLSTKYHTNKQSGELISAVGRAQLAFPILVEACFLHIVPVIFEITLATIIICKLYGLEYGLILFVTIICYLVSTILTVKQSVFTNTIKNQKQNKTAAYFLDVILNYEAVKIFCNENFEANISKALIEDDENTTAWTYGRMSLISMCQMCIIGIGLTALTVRATYGITAGELTSGDFILLNGYLLQFSLPMGYFGYVIRSFSQSLTDISYIVNLLQKKPETISSIDAINLTDRNATLTFNNVSFGYDNNSSVLKNISFCIPHGKTLAIVGKTGSGKSTIAKLIPRLYNVTSGSICIGSTNINNITLDSLRSSISIIPQDVALFNRTIYENIIYGNNLATLNDVQKAIEAANLQSCIHNLPDGYNTIIGERGVKLSGGEKQRIAIARAILKNTKIYIFDESTASLDTRTEKEIQHNLNKISTGITTLIIAHRLSTVLHADEILVLEDGEIAECGTHESLLKIKGIYFKMWVKQLGIKASNELEIVF